MPRGRRLAAGLAVAVVCGGSPLAVAIAADPLTPEATTLSDAEIDKRLRFIEEKLDAHRLYGQIWYWGWMAVNAGGAIGTGIMAGLSNDQDDIVNNAVSSGLAVIGVADLVFRPLDARLGAAPIATLPEATRAERIDKLRAAEAQLRANAERAEERTSWTVHAANLGINALGGVIIGVLGDTKDAAISAAANFAGGIAYILTQPAAPARDWREYQAMAAGTAARAPVVALALQPYTGGAGLRMTVSW
ncbi:MAG: hypothetical protein U1E66_06030 [Rhodospirillales bacterium]